MSENISIELTQEAVELVAECRGIFPGMTDTEITLLLLKAGLMRAEA